MIATLSFDLDNPNDRELYAECQAVIAKKTGTHPSAAAQVFAAVNPSTQAMILASLAFGEGEQWTLEQWAKEADIPYIIAHDLLGPIARAGKNRGRKLFASRKPSSTQAQVFSFEPGVRGELQDIKDSLDN
jgi:hypothetical protein